MYSIQSILIENEQKIDMKMVNTCDCIDLSGLSTENSPKITVLQNLLALKHTQKQARTQLAYN